eukprot:UN15144
MVIQEKQNEDSGRLGIVIYVGTSMNQENEKSYNGQP